MAQDTAQIRKVQDKEGTQFFPITHVDAVIDENGDAVSTLLAGKQATLVSGTNIKTINSQSLLGSGDIVIEGGGGIDSIVMNGDAVTVTGGVADLGTVITQHQDISGKADKVSNSTNGNFAGLDAGGNLTDSGHKHSDYQAALVSGTNIKTVNSTSLLGSGNVSVGTYSKPSGGIPKTDLASAVQTSLGKADTALQSYTETDPVFTASAAAGIATTDISAWNAKLSGVTFNGAAATVTGGVAAITATIPAAPGTLQTNLSTAQSTSASEALSGSIKLHKIAKTGTYSDLIGTPTIPTKVSELTNDAGYTTNTGTVTRVDVGTSQYSPTGGIVSLPAYPTTLPASDVSAWAKAANKPSYTLDEVSDGSTRKLADYLPLTGGAIQSASSYARLRLVTTSAEAYVQAGTSSENAGTLYLTGYNASIGSTLALQFSNVYAWNGSSFSQILHAGNYSSYALPLTGGTLKSSERGILYLNQETSSTGVVGPYIEFQVNGTLTAGVGSSSSVGAYLENDNADRHPYVNLDNNGVFKYKNTYTFWHSGNANLSTVPWSCSTLTASDYVTGPTLTASNGYITQNRTTGISLSNIDAIANSSNAWNSSTTYSLLLHNANNALSFIVDGVANARAAMIQCGHYANNFAHALGTLALNPLGGDVGIGTLTPSEKLHIVGSILATGTITPGSDSRIKNNQKDISQEVAFSVIENLKPKTWIWNEKSNENLNGKSAAGLVAQDVKEILPDAVTISENGDIKDFHSLNYNTIQGYELAAIKGLIEEVKSLKAEVAELKKQIK